MPERIGTAAAVVSAAWLILILSGKGVLVSQEMSQPGQPYLVEGWGDLGKAASPSLVCTYFIGTRLRKQVFWYSPNGMFGKADCPMFVDRQTATSDRQRGTGK
jgi:hypothetical protein